MITLSFPEFTSAAGTVAPAPVTRAQFTADLVQELHVTPETTASQAFSDLPPGSPEYGPIMAAYAEGWMSGYPDGTFRPGAPLTREQVAKSEVLALGLGSAAAGLVDQAPPFGDANLIGKWAWGYVDEAARIGILRGFSPSTFGPQMVLTSAQVLHLQTQLAAYLAKSPAPPLSSAPAAAPGTAAGTTAIAVTPQTGDHIATLVSQGPVSAPLWNATPPAVAVPYTPGADLAAAAGDYVAIYEVDQNGTVAAFSQIQLTSADVTSPPTAIAVNGPPSGPAGGSAEIGPFTVSLTDAQGNPAPAPAGGLQLTLSTNSAAAHEFALSQAGAPVALLTVPAGATSASFYYGDVATGAQTLSVGGSGLTGGSASIQITGGAPAALSLLGPQSGSTDTAASMGPFTISLEDAYGNAAPAPSGGEMVTLGSSSFGVHEFALSAAGTPISSILIPAGETSANFYYGDAQAGSPTLTATAPGIGSAQMSVSLSSATATQLTLSGPQTASAGASASNGPFTVTLSDAQGNPVPAPGTGVMVALSSTSPQHEFAAAAQGAPQTAVMIPAGSSSATFYYGDSSGGTPTITASAPGLAPATLQLEIAVPLPMTGQALDSPDSPATLSQVLAWKSQGYGTIILNTLAPSFDQQYAASLGVMNVLLFQGYYTPAFEYESGSQRAQQAINAAESVGYPKGAYIFVDVESTGTDTSQQLLDWINAWSSAVQSAGYGAGVYYGVPQPLSATQAGSVLADRFWQSLSSNAVVPSPRGVCIVQTGYNGALDQDVFQTDNLGEYCIGAGL